MHIHIFIVRLLIAVALGAIIGAERQLRQRLAGLRTNALVSAGSALFVLVTALSDDRDATARIAAQVVSGIGFLGAGVIMREGLNVRGLNTAATLWCSAAIGVMSAFGEVIEAAAGALTVLGANIVLRGLTQRINRQDVKTATELEHRYRVTVTCRDEDEVRVRTLLLHAVAGMSLVLQSLTSTDREDEAGRVEVSAELTATLQNQAQLEQLVSRISLETGVTSVRWAIVKEAGD
ncbi:MAG TPA: MgtC/SapB family protein [Burkholderiaceae bacterium]|jgi:putative Mg2+ transporter-C (MgtC) family protein|nr:MgtC/SapB family protein [Burkholderiaceae bacterium]